MSKNRNRSISPECPVNGSYSFRKDVPLLSRDFRIIPSSSHRSSIHQFHSGVNVSDGSELKSHVECSPVSSRVKCVKGKAVISPSVSSMNDKVVHVNLVPPSENFDKSFSKLNLSSNLKLNDACDVRDFETNPNSALKMLAINSGLHRFHSVEDLYNQKGDLIDDVERSEIVSSLLSEIHGNFNPSDSGRLVKDFQKEFDVKANLIACACCGMRSFESTKASFHRFNVLDLRCLILSPEEKADYFLIPPEFRKGVSVYQSSDETLYHLHSSFIKSHVDSLGINHDFAVICGTCHSSLLSQTIPRFSLANGIDFGNADAIGLPTLTLIEEYLIAKSRLYVNIIKLKGSTGDRSYSAKLGHVISFPHESEKVELITNCDSSQVTCLPNFHDISDFIAVVFVGSRLQWESFVPNRGRYVQELKIRPDVVFQWLRALQSLNPSYRDVTIDESVETKLAMLGLPKMLFDAVTIVDDDTDIAMDCVISSESDSYNRDSDECNAGAGLDDFSSSLPVSFLTNRQRQSLTSSSSANQQVLNSLLAALSPHSSVLRKDPQLNACQKSVVYVSPGRQPYNEFDSNDQLLYDCFPSLFVLRKGISVKGTLPVSSIRHMMFQYSNKFAKCIRFIFLLFDQMQRHSAAKVVASQVKSCPQSLEAFGHLVNEPSFFTELENASRDPTLDSSVSLLKRVMPHIHTCASSVPFSSSERKASLSNLTALLTMYGLPSIFFTFAPDDTHGILNTRLSFPQKDNFVFPSVDDGFNFALLHGESVFLDFPLDASYRKKLLIENPMASAQVFLMLSNAVFDVLLGTPSHFSVKKTSYLLDRPNSVFGTPVASFGCVEEQSRGSLHMHVIHWGSLPPRLLQLSANVPVLKKAILTTIDSFVKGQLHYTTHLECILNRIEHVVTPRPCYYCTHDPEEDPVGFDVDVQRAVAACNIHCHNAICHKSVIGKCQCRLCRPQETICESSVTQIKASRSNCKKTVDYEIVPNFEPLNPDSLKWRNVSSIPFPLPDNRLLIFEMARPSFPKMLSTLICVGWENSQFPFTQYDLSRLPSLIERLSKYDSVEFIEKELQFRNGYVVEFNPVVSALIGCNTNVSVLGCEAQAKAILFYLLKYVTKPPAEIAHSLSILYHIRKEMTCHPSTASDVGTDKRSAMQFITKMANSLNGAIEVSAPMASLAILGSPAEVSSCSFFLVFVSAACHYVKNHQLYSDSQYEKNVADEFQNCSELHCKSTSTKDACLVEKTGCNECDSPRTGSCYDENFLRSVFEEFPDEEFDPLNKDDGNSDVLSEKYPVGNSPVYHGSKGVVAVPQHIHYSFRGSALKNYSLYEYAALIDVIPSKFHLSICSPKNSKSSLPIFCQQSTFSNEAEVGRRSNTCLHFDPQHPLAETHVQRLRSKMKVPKIVDRIPKSPAPKSKCLSDSWKQQARKFSQFYLILFRPWTYETDFGTLPGPLSWHALCQFVLTLQNPDVCDDERVLNSVCLQWMSNLHRGLRAKNIDRLVVQQYRSRSATRWDVDRNSVETDSCVIGCKEEEAREIIDQLRSEAESNERFTKREEKVNVFLDFTRKSVQKIMSPFLLNMFTMHSASPSEMNLNSLLHPTNDFCINIESVLLELCKEPICLNSVDNGKPFLMPSCTKQFLLSDPVWWDEPNFTPSQRLVLMECYNYFVRKINSPNNCDPLHLLVHGGPGTGKSYLIKALFEMAKKMGIYVACMASTGIAASLLPEGKTIHSALHIPINKPKTADGFLDRLSIDVKLALQRRLKTDSLGMIVMDEFFTEDNYILGQADHRLRDILENNSPLGSMAVILVGDCYQLPPVATANSLASAVVKSKVFGLSLDPVGSPLGPCNSGANLFSAFKKIELVEQVRCASDPIHIAMLSRMRQPSSNETRIDPVYLSRLKPLKSSDIFANPEWIKGPVVVTSNKERHIINDLQSTNWSILNNTPKFTWREEISDNSIKHFSSQNKDIIYGLLPELENHFVAGAPGYLTENINPSIGLTNGTPVLYHSLQLDPREDFLRIQGKVGEKELQIRLEYSPTLIFVEIPNANYEFFKDKTIIPNRVVLPLSLKSASSYVNENSSDKRRKINIRYKCHSVELGFALTIYKLQGQTCDRIIVDLNPRPFKPQFNFHSLYVALSRVKSSENIRIMPFQPLVSNLAYLHHLEPEPVILSWLSGFNEEGNWNPSLIKRSIDVPRKSSSIRDLNFSVKSNENHANIKNEPRNICLCKRKDPPLTESISVMKKAKISRKSDEIKVLANVDEIPPNIRKSSRIRKVPDRLNYKKRGEN